MEEVTLTVEGTRVYGQHFAADGKPTGTAVLLHGFASCLREFGLLPQCLAEAGIACLAIDMRGHGLSAGERGRLGLDRALHDVQAAATWLKQRYPKQRIALVGHSLGGSLALGIAARSEIFDALVVAHPVDRLFDELSPVEKAIYHVAGRVGHRRLRKGRRPGMLPRRTRYRDLFVDKERARRAKQESFWDERVNVGNYTFATTMQASDWARRVRIPVLCVQSPHDKTVAPEHTRDVCNALAGPTEVLVHEGGHSCFLDQDAEHVQGGIERYLVRMLGGTA